MFCCSVQKRPYLTRLDYTRILGHPVGIIRWVNVICVLGFLRCVSQSNQVPAVPEPRVLMSAVEAAELSSRERD